MRRIGFAVVVAVALLTACGRQVTPDLPGVGPGGLSPGYMSVKFDVAGPLNFAQDEYIVAFNTSGSSAVPDTNVLENGYTGYSYAIVVRGNPNGAYANAYEYYRSPNSPIPARLPIGTTGQQLQLNANSNGQGTEFTVTFARVVFDGIKPPGSASPPPVSSSWNFNAFTGGLTAFDTWIYTDSMGVGGPNDPQWTSLPPLPVNQQFDTVYPALYGGTPFTDQGAQIESVEFANNP